TVVGDITAAHLGIEEASARKLQRSLTSAYHLAAVYDLAVKREVAHRVNVDGTRNVLRFLADAPRLQRLHYVSTCYVSGRAPGTFRESDLDVGQSFRNHYEETKFLAEVDVVRSGLPATTYRPGIVVGDSRTGETGKFDGPYYTLAAMERVPSPGLFIRIGSGRAPANLVPVDYVVEGLARLSSSAKSRGQTYQLTDPAPLPAFEVGKLMAAALGKSFVYVPVPLMVARTFFTPGPVQRFFGMPAETLDYFADQCHYDTSNATRDLEPLGVRCPRLPEYFDRLVAFYRLKRDGVRRQAMV
ncbi:MAG TPA: SDR family oxidoreductase, partial [Vicinamibacteria bacterium]|nr:SDR family oxidoreductase [Vicinamibacteria bacterium]